MAKTKIRKLQAGVPPAGTTGQVLKKNSNTDFDYDWGNASGGGDVFSVNADEEELTNFSTQLSGPVTFTSSGITNGWSVHGSTGSSFSPQGANSFQFSNAQIGGGYTWVYNSITAPSPSNLNIFSADTPNVVRLKWYGAVSSSNQATQRIAFGFTDQIGASTFYSESSTSDRDVKFVFAPDLGQVFAVCSNGSVVTAVNTGVDPRSFHIYEIVITPQVNVKFYIDGVLVATITTSLYASGSQALLIEIGALAVSGGVITIFINNPVFSITV